MISQWCDNLRTPIGRRIPLLYVFAPLTVVTLIGVGFAPEMGQWLHSWAGGLLPSTTTAGTVTLGLLCVLVVSFHFFNMVLVNGYNWLVRDVVPLSVMSRFLAWFSIVGAVSGTLFLWFVFPHLLEHRQVIFLGVGVFYIVAFFLMCMKVKEGEYPPPAQKAEQPGIVRTFVTYFRECLQIRLYRHFFLACLLMIAATTGANNFITLFARESLGLNMGQLGHVFAWTSAISVLFFYPTGWLCDRFSPMHIALISIILIIVSQLMAFLFVGGWLGFFIYSLAYALPAVAWGLCQRASSMKLFPAEKFGQFLRRPECLRLRCADREQFPDRPAHGCPTERLPICLSLGRRDGSRFHPFHAYRPARVATPWWTRPLCPSPAKLSSDILHI